MTQYYMPRRRRPFLSLSSARAERRARALESFGNAHVFFRPLLFLEKKIHPDGFTPKSNRSGRIFCIAFWKRA